MRKYKLPDSPGVYFFENEGGVMYIGRATSLQNRVRSYFRDDILKTRGKLIADMVSRARTLRWQKTPSVLETVIAEANLIKKFQPPYNTEEKDDKSFNYLVITREDYPRVVTVRGKDLKERYPKSSVKHAFGPYPNGSTLTGALKIVRKIMPYRDGKCHPLRGRPFRQAQGRPCFNRQIGLCPGVCTGEISKEEYLKTINMLKLFFLGRNKALLKGMEREMMNQARMQNFERAQEIKRQIFALTHIQDVALIKDDYTELLSKQGDSYRIESYDVAHLGGKSMVGVMTVAQGGQLKKSEYRVFNVRNFVKANDTGALREIISRRLKHKEWPLPDLVVVDGNETQRRAAERLFGGIPVVAVVKDDKHRPKEILGNNEIVYKNRRIIMLLNSEAHRFSIKYHRKMIRRELF